MSASRFVAGWLVLAVCLAAGATRAQDAPFVMPESEHQEDVIFEAPTSSCTEGRVLVDGGYCCWPAQHASAEGRCVGPPRCPAGLAASGADCVAPTGSTSTAPVARDGSFASHDEAPPRNQVDGGLLGGGITLILLGWLGNGITDTIGGGQVNYSAGFGRVRAALPSWPFGWLPILHPLAALDGDGSWRDIAVVVGSIGAVLEITGLIMAIAGSIGHPPAVLRRLGMRLGTSGADAGMSIELAF